MSWHNSAQTQKLYAQAVGKRVRLIAKVTQALWPREQKFYNLEFFKWIGDEKVSEMGMLIKP